MSRNFKLSSFTPSFWGSCKGVFSMMREEKLFSAIHIAGTAMAIAFTMVMAVVYYIKLAPIYPEVNRMRTVYFDGVRIQAERYGMFTHYGYKSFKEWFQNSPNIEYCTPTILAAGSGRLDKNCHDFVVKGKDEYIDVIKNITSADFFKIYEYDFLEGRPFTRQEVEAKEHVAVISDALAERLFGKDVEAVGRIVKLTNTWIKEVRVVGVVRGASQLTPDSYADIIMPYTLWWFDNYTGSFSIIVTVKDNEQMQALKRELDDISARALQAHPEILKYSGFAEHKNPKMILTETMETHPMYALRRENGQNTFRMMLPGMELFKHYAGILFVLLFVPALNLCGIIAGRLERRTAEMAVRKTFGARRSTLLNQVVWENLVLTSIGGIIGLVISWISIYTFRTEILGLFFDNSTLTSAPIVSGEMLFAPTLFLGAFVAVVVLNLLAAVVPAWWSLRKPIVESMMEKR